MSSVTVDALPLPKLVFFTHNASVSTALSSLGTNSRTCLGFLFLFIFTKTMNRSGRSCTHHGLNRIMVGFMSKLEFRLYILCYWGGKKLHISFIEIFLYILL